MLGPGEKTMAHTRAWKGQPLKLGGAGWGIPSLSHEGMRQTDKEKDRKMETEHPKQIIFF